MTTLPIRTAHEKICLVVRADRGTGPEDPLKFATSDSPSPYLFESQVEMIGRLAGGRTRRARIAARIVASVVLLPIVIGVLLGMVNLFR